MGRVAASASPLGRLLAGSALASLLAGCGSAQVHEPRPAPSVSPAEVDQAMSHWEPGPEPTAPARSLRPLEQTVHIKAPPEAPPRRRSGRRVDVELHRATLPTALQLLADEARVNLVLGEGLQGEVSLSLKRVDPLEALEAVAAAQNLQIEHKGAILIVRRR